VFQFSWQNKEKEISEKAVSKISVKQEGVNFINNSELLF
jgi:hypothetical protein